MTEDMKKPGKVVPFEQGHTHAPVVTEGTIETNARGGKQSNPKDSVGTRKAPMHVVPCEVLLEIGLAMMEGSRKYGSHNYRAVGVRASVYYDALMRHIMAWWEGEDIDQDSGVSHIVKAMTCLVVLRDSMHMENWTDDRPVQLLSGIDMSQLNQKASDIIDGIPNSVSPFLNKEEL